MHGENEKYIHNIIRKSQGMSPLRCRWEDNIKIDLRETGYEGVDLIDSEQCPMAVL
jgi:hypothetical protein